MSVRFSRRGRNGDEDHREAKPFLDVCFDGDLMQRCAGVPGSGRLSRGSKGCVPQWGRIEGRSRRGAVHFDGADHPAAAVCPAQ